MKGYIYRWVESVGYGTGRIDTSQWAVFAIAQDRDGANTLASTKSEVLATLIGGNEYCKQLDGGGAKSADFVCVEECEVNAGTVVASWA